MFSKSVKVVSEVGLYGRSATSFIQLANTFRSTVFIEYSEKKANAKSLLGVLSLAVPNDAEVTITANGTDEIEAINSLVDFVSSGCLLPSDLRNDEDAPIVGSVDPNVGSVDPKKS